MNQTESNQTRFQSRLEPDVLFYVEAATYLTPSEHRWENFHDEWSIFPEDDQETMISEINAWAGTEEYEAVVRGFEVYTSGKKEAWPQERALCDTDKRFKTLLSAFRSKQIRPFLKKIQTCREASLMDHISAHKSTTPQTA